MKFGKTIETSAKELPEDWQPYIIQYKLLKKNIKGIVKELDDTFKTLNLLPPTTLNDAGDAISVSDQSCGRSIISEVGEHGGVVDIPDSASVVSVTSPTLSAYVGSPEEIEYHIEMRLQADQLFFDQLINYIDRTRAFEKEYTKQYNSNVTALGSELTTVTSPHTEGDFRPTNTAKEGQERFAEFTQHIKKLGLANKFRDSVSAKLLMSFYKLNSELMYMKLLQEMNEEATRKILKKHDKRTHLVAKTQFPQFVTFDTTSLTKALIYTIYTDLVGIVPQIDDYLCPMCLNIAWRPLRLECNHIFCSRCVVKASRRHMFDCPVCRAKGAIYRAGVENIDKALLNFMKLYFPREVKEKQRD
ncbi:hypothetical protein GQ54DRAFT_270662, partial [Martensiomyces pterosporus]